jgi:acetoin utilization deacetylase AcuC-like enzyme
LAPHNCSTFQHPCYPHRDIEMTYANIVDVPLPAETTGAEFRVAVEVRWLSMLEQLRPQLIMIAAPDHLFLVV